VKVLLGRLARILSASSLLLASCADDPDVLCEGDAACELACPDGYCNFYCDGSSSCTGGCAGGECTLTCTGDAHCEFACPTGDCALFCQDRARCSFECDGCRTSCADAATCD
jgi:hypothetical protein